MHFLAAFSHNDRESSKTPGEGRKSRRDLAKSFYIILAWNDGKIRAFTPETGRLMYVIEHAHSMGVTAVATTSDGKRIISGGGEGQVMSPQSPWISFADFTNFCTDGFLPTTHFFLMRHMASCAPLHAE